MSFQEANAPWWESYARWLEKGEVGPVYRVRAVIGDRHLLVARNRRSVRVPVHDHDWSDAYAEGRWRLNVEFKEG